LAAGLTWLVLCPLPVHAAVSRASAATAAVPTCRLSLRPAAPSLRRIL